jgi:hypothetical protein
MLRSLRLPIYSAITDVGPIRRDAVPTKTTTAKRGEADGWLRRAHDREGSGAVNLWNVFSGRRCRSSKPDPRERSKRWPGSITAWRGASEAGTFLASLTPDAVALNRTGNYFRVTGNLIRQKAIRTRLASSAIQSGVLPYIMEKR